MADKSNSFRDVALPKALGQRGVRWVRAWPNGAAIDLYTWEHRWLALMVYQSRVAATWWGISDHLFRPLRGLEVQHDAYLVVGLLQDDPEAGTLLVGADLEKSMAGCSADRTGNVKLFPEDIEKGGAYLRGADRIAEAILELLRGCPPDPDLSADVLIPTRPRRRRRSRLDDLLLGSLEDEGQPSAI